MSFVTVEVDREQLKEAIRWDCVTCLSFYLGEELTLEVPEFHEEIWDEFLAILETVSHPDFLIGHLQKLFAVPREHSKSTLAKLAVILFMRYSPLAFTLYVSKTATVALNAIKDIVAWFKSPREVELYGAPEVEKSNETEGLWILWIYRADGSRKRIILKAVGQQHQVRGLLIDSKRPELVIIDDIEDYDTADGGTQQQKLDTWAMGALMKATARRSVRIFIGNMVRSTTLLARLSKDSEWNPTVFGALVRDKETKQLKPLWPGRWTTESLLAEYRKYRKAGMGHIWETEMMNLSADSILTRSLDNAIIIPDVSPEQITGGFICLDPAFGKKAWHDESALTVHVRVKGYGIPFICDSRVGKWSEDQILDQFVELSYYWNLTTWCIESVAAQKLLIPLFRLLLRDREVNPDLFTMLPIQLGTTTKASRIVGFRDTVAAKSYGLTEGQIDVKLKLEEYTPDTEDHDDLCDSAAYGPAIWNLYESTIEANGIHNVAGRLLQPDTHGVNMNNEGEVDVCPI